MFIEGFSWGIPGTPHHHRYDTFTRSPMHRNVLASLHRSLTVSRGVNFFRAHWGLVILLGLTLAHRIAFFRWWKAFPGGDTYNFILIAQELLKGSYPVAEKRLPFYPALIALAHTVVDWETAAIVVACTASLASVALLYAIGRTLGLSSIALGIGLAPFQAIAPFLFQSVRGYADTTFIALMLGALLAFLRTRSRRGAIITGILFALASLTRFEGAFLVIVLPVLALLCWRPRRLIQPALAAIAVCWLPFALLFISVGRPLLPVEYFSDAEATPFGVTNAKEFLRNYGEIWKSVGFDRIWKEPRRVLRDVATLAVETWPVRLRSFVTDPKELPSLFVLAGIVFLLRKRLSVLAPVVLLFLVLAVPIAWWGVRQRFLIVLYPFFFLCIAAGIEECARLLRRMTKRWPLVERLTPRMAALILLGLSLGPWTAHTAAEAREVYQKNLGTDYAYYQAIRAAQALPGTIAFEHRSSIVLALFGEKDEGHAVFAETHLSTPISSEQWEALKKWGVRYVVIRGTESEAFPVLSDPQFRDRISREFIFEFPQQNGKISRATIYRIH